MLIYGAGGHAKVVISALKDSGISIHAVFDDDPDKRCLIKTPITQTYHPDFHAEQPLIIAVGDNLVRKKLAAIVTHRFANACHFSSLIEGNVVFGSGNVILHRAVIQADVSIGNHCIVNTGALVGHDCRIADFAHIGPGAILCGNVAVGECTLIGAGSVILPNVTIGKNCIIGAGSVVTKNIPDGTLVCGNPARIIQSSTL